MGIYDIKNTATGEVGANPVDEVGSEGPSSVGTPDIQVIDLPQDVAPQAPQAPTEGGIQPLELNLPEWGEDFQDVSDVDFEYMNKIFAGDSLNNNLAASAQTGWSKTMNALGGGIAKGVSAAFAPVISIASETIGLFDEALAAEMGTYNAALRQSLTENFNYHDYDLSKNAGFIETFKRFGTLDSMVESSVQFGLLNLGVGAAVGAVGKAFLASGGAAESALLSARVGQGLAKDIGAKVQSIVGGTGKLMTEGVRLGGVNALKSNTIIQASASNYLEGVVMADQMGQEMKSTFSDALNDPNVSEATKDLIKSNIADAQTSLQIYNTALVFNDYIGLSKLTKAVNKSAFSKSPIKSLVGKEGFAAFSLSEGAEEIGQGVLESKMEMGALLNLEKGYRGLDANNKIDGVEGADMDPKEPRLDSNGNPIPEYNQEGKEKSTRFNPENTLLAQVDPEKANQISQDNSRTFGDYIMHHATSAETLTEGLSGVLGGGPQYALIGGPRYFFNRKNIDIQKKEQKELLKNTADVFQAASLQQLRTDAQLSAVQEDLKDTLPEGSTDGYLNTILDDYITVSTALNSIKRKSSDEVTEILDTQLKTNKEALAKGDLTQDQYDILTKRIELGKQTIEEYKHYDSYINKDELVDAALKKEAYRAAKYAFINSSGNEELLMAENNPEPEVIEPTKPTEPVIPPQATPKDDGVDYLADHFDLEDLPLGAAKDNAVAEVVSDEDFNSFVDDGKTKPSTINSIVTKITKNEPLSERERAISQGSTKEINEKLKAHKHNNIVVPFENKSTGKKKDLTVVFDPDGNAAVYNAKGKQIYTPGSKFAHIGEEVIRQAEEVRGTTESENTPIPGGETVLSPNNEVAASAAVGDIDIADIGDAVDYIRTIDKAIEQIDNKMKVMISGEGQLAAHKQQGVIRKWEKRTQNVKNSTNQEYVQSLITALEEEINEGKVLREENGLAHKHLATSVAHLAILQKIDEEKSQREVEQAEKKKQESPKGTKDLEENEITNAEYNDETLGDSTGEEAIYTFGEEFDLEDLPTEEGVPTEVVEQKNTEVVGPVKQDALQPPPPPPAGTGLLEAPKINTKEGKLRADKTVEEYVSENPREPSSAREGAVLGASQMNEMEDSGRKQNAHNPNTVEGAEYTKDTKEAFDVVERLLNMYEKHNPGLLPDFDTTLYMAAKVMQVDSSEIRSFVEDVYSFVNGTPGVKPKSNDKKALFTRDTSDDKYKIETQKVDTDVVRTTASYDITSAAFAHVGPLTQDYTVVKDGVAVEYIPMTDDEVVSYNEEETKRAKKANVEPRLIQLYFTEDGFTHSISLADLHEARELSKTDPNFAEFKKPIYSETNTRPITVKIAEGPHKGQVIGAIHAAQFLAYPKGDITQGQIEAALVNLEGFRKGILSGKIRTGVINNRKNNIQSVETIKHKGVSIATTKEKRSGVDAFGMDSNIIVTAAVENKETGVIELAKEGRALILQKNPDAQIVFNPEAMTSGAPIVMVRLEDSNVYTAQRMDGSQVSRQAYSTITGYITRLTDPDKATGYSISPLGIVRNLENSVNIKFNLDGAKPDTLKYNVQLGAMTEGKSQQDIKITVGLKTQRRSITLHGTKGTERETAKGSVAEWNYKVVAVESSDTTQPGITNFKEDLNKGREMFNTYLKGVESEALPYNNININLLHSVQEKSPKTGVHARVFSQRNGKWGLHKVPYKTHVLEVVRTTIKPGVKMSDGTVSYTTNAIITLDTDNVRVNNTESKETEKKIKEQNALKEQISTLQNARAKLDTISSELKRLHTTVEKGITISTLNNLTNYFSIKESEEIKKQLQKLAKLWNRNNKDSKEKMTLEALVALTPALSKVTALKTKKTKEINALRNSQELLDSPTDDLMGDLDNDMLDIFGLEEDIQEEVGTTDTLLDEVQDPVVIKETRPSATELKLKMAASGFMNRIVAKMFSEGAIKIEKKDGTKC